MKEYKLTSLSTGLIIGQGAFESVADAWMELSRLSENNIVAVLWMYDEEIPYLLSDSKNLIKAYTEEVGEEQNKIPAVKYYLPFCIGLTGEDFAPKKYSIDLNDPAFVKTSNPNSLLYIPPKEMERLDNVSKTTSK